MAVKGKKLTGVQKVALLLFCLGEDVTAKVFDALDDGEVR